MIRLGLGCWLCHPWVEKAKLNLFEFFSPQIKNEARLNKNTAPRAALDTLLCMQKNMNYISGLIMIDRQARIVGGKK